MNSDNKFGSLGPVFTSILLLGAAAGVFFWQRPLSSFRHGAPGVEPPAAVAQIDARLWQDPFTAIREADARNGDEEVCDLVKRKPSKGDDPLGIIRDNQPTLVLPVMVPDSPTLNDYEKRLRSRYAMLAALDATGYHPLRGDRIGCASIEDWHLEERRNPQLVVPYEEFIPDDLHVATDSSTRLYDRVIVLWVEERALQENDPAGGTAPTFFAKFGELLDSVLGTEAKNSAVKPTVRLLGPASSATLKQMYAWTDNHGKDDPVPWNLEVYSYRATIDDRLIGSEEPHFLTRTTATDLELACLLVEELGRREIEFTSNTDESDDADETRDADEADDADETSDERDRVAVVAEWDTLYGRALALSFAACVSARMDEPNDKTPFPDDKTPNLKPLTERAGRTLKEFQRDGQFRWPETIHRVTYLRGLDGKLWDTPKDDKQKQNSQQTPVGGGEAEQFARPVGRSRLDYARRLADRLHSEENRTLKAIGVLGGDVYDKLLLIQALRVRFPYAVFFTTDLDARLLHRSQSSWARNLVVASSYGLDVGRRDADEVRALQIAVRPPPFRSAYQTSLYVAASTAILHGNESGDPEPMRLREALRTLKKPKLFEIGRTRLHSLQEKEPERSEHKAAHETNTLQHGTIRLIGLGFLLAACFSHVALGRRGWGKRQQLKSLIAHLVFLSVVFWIGWQLIHGDSWAEPLVLFDGVSIWPTEILRLLAALLSVHFLLRAWLNLSRSNMELQTKFALASGAKPDPEPRDRQPRWKSRIRARITSVRTGFSDFVKLFYRNQVEDYGDKLDASCCWADYRRLDRVRPRLVRVALLVSIYFVLCFPAFLLFRLPVVPGRGETSFTIDKHILIFSVFLQLVLIFFVLDAILACGHYVRCLIGGRTRWSSEAFANWTTEVDKSRVVPTEWLDIQMVARRTEVVGGLLLYPFMVLLIMILSRLSYFDNWDWPLPLILVLSANSVWVLGSAVVLRRWAERARRTALHRLKTRRLHWKAAGDQSRADELSIAISDIEACRQGSFAPFSEQPVVRAILLPFGGIGTAVVLESMATSL